MTDARTARYGQAVQFHREQRGWSQAQLAERLGYDSASMISQIEQGLAVPSIDKAITMAEAFETTVDAMWAFDGHAPRSVAILPGARQLYVPSTRGTIHLSGWNLEETLKILRALKDVGVLFDHNVFLHEPPRADGTPAPEEPPAPDAS